MTHYHNLSSVANQADTQNIYGDVHFTTAPAIPTTPPNYNLGVRLGLAPQIADHLFVGREDELKQLQTWLIPTTGKQNVVAMCGAGGMGKTQLSMHFIRHNSHQYSSVWWLNAKNQITLQASLARLMIEVDKTYTTSSLTSADNEQQLVQQARQWLSEPDNDQWLMILDNYDDVLLQGVNDSMGYDIRAFFPFRTQGSILITTRSPRLTFARPLVLAKLNDTTQGLSVLALRSGRNIDGDKFAYQLARRLDGLPLALATAGAYLSQSADSFDDYLQLYNHNWHELSCYDAGPEDYEERTLYTTWGLSFQRVQIQDAAAAELLKLFAYFDNQDLWYELFHMGLELNDAPAWWEEVLRSRARFNQAMSVLSSHSLLDTGPGFYRLHPCIHDWTLEYLNHELDEDRYRLAWHCIASNVSWSSEPQHWVRNRQVLPHARRLQHDRFKKAMSWTKVEPESYYCLGCIFAESDMYHEAEQMYIRALQGYEVVEGVEHRSVLFTVNCLGTLYYEQGRLVEAEQMYVRALQGKEKALGLDHDSTLQTANDLGSLYAKQGKLVAAERMFLRALQGYEQAWGVEHTSMFVIMGNLGNLYCEQGKLEEAEQMYVRALQGKEKALGVDHILTLPTVHNLGTLYNNQGKLVAAEKMYTRALQGYEKAQRGEHTSALNTVYNLGVLYYEQGKLEEAEQMYLRASQGYEKAAGRDHPQTQLFTRNLNDLQRLKKDLEATRQQAEPVDRTLSS